MVGGRTLVAGFIVLDGKAANQALFIGGKGKVAIYNQILKVRVVYELWQDSDDIIL